MCDEKKVAPLMIDDLTKKFNNVTPVEICKNLRKIFKYRLIKN